MKSAKRFGFTMIEVVIAIAIAAVMIVAVQSATQAMTLTARKQREAADSAMRFQRLIEIVRRDFQGWIVSEGSGAPAISPKLETDQLILRFTTTADTLTVSVPTQPGKSSCCRRSVSDLRYVLHQQGVYSEVIRTEFSNGISKSEIVLWRGIETPRFEYLRANKWTSEWSGKERPQGMRIAVGTDCITFLF